MKKWIFLLFLMIQITFLENLNSANITLQKNTFGIWKYKIDLDGSKYKTEEEAFTAADYGKQAAKCNSDFTIEDGNHVDNLFTNDNTKFINSSWSITQDIFTFNFTWVGDGKSYTDKYKYTLANDEKHVVLALISTTQETKLAYINKCKVYCVKQAETGSQTK